VAIQPTTEIVNMKITIKKGSIEAFLVHDELAENPREHCDNFGKMVSFHPKHVIGDEHSLSKEEANRIIRNMKEYVSFPLYLYDHSGLILSTKPFSCRWDSSQIGLIYVSIKDVENELGTGVDARKKAEALLKSEVDVYNQYLTGDVYNVYVYDVSVNPHSTLDYVCGVYGIDYAEEIAKEFVERYNIQLTFNLD
jgi:hypothetical protein